MPVNEANNTKFKKGLLSVFSIYLFIFLFKVNLFIDFWLSFKKLNSYDNYFNYELILVKQKAKLPRQPVHGGQRVVEHISLVVVVVLSGLMEGGGVENCQGDVGTFAGRQIYSWS